MQIRLFTGKRPIILLIVHVLFWYFFWMFFAYLFQPLRKVCNMTYDNKNTGFFTHQNLTGGQTIFKGIIYFQGVCFTEHVL